MSNYQDEFFFEESNKIDRDFAKFHAENPHVFDALAEMALGMVHKGITRYSIAGLYEVLRYRHTLDTRDEEAGYKLCNNYRALYSRLLMDRYPELAGFFAIKTRK